MGGMLERVWLDQLTPGRIVILAESRRLGFGTEILLKSLSCRCALNVKKEEKWLNCPGNWLCKLSLAGTQGKIKTYMIIQFPEPSLFQGQKPTWYPQAGEANINI